MGCELGSRCVFVVVCILQLVTVCVRQVFDFIGLQWTPIIANFCQITVLILALLGAYRYKRRNIAVYSTWTLFWIGWNIFLVCLYLDIGTLNLNDHSLALNLALTDSHSWFKNTTFSCDSMVTPATISITSTSSNVTLECIIDFRYIEVVQAGLQIMLACFGFVISCYLIGVFEDDDYDLNLLGTGIEKRKQHGQEESPLVRSHRVSEA